MSADRALKFLIIFNAGILLLAAPCALLPFERMDRIHRDWLDLGPLSDSSMTRYLTRSLSLCYALHGGVLLALANDWRRYRGLVPVVAWLQITFGCAMLAIGLDANLPWWWVAAEGPGLMAHGIVLVALYRRASRAAPSAQ
jgi:hypothetical protein